MKMDISQLEELEQTIAKRERMQELREAAVKGTRLYIGGTDMKHLRLVELLAVGDRLRSERAYKKAYDLYIEALGRTTTPADSRLVIGPEDRAMVMTRLERLVKSIMQDKELSKEDTHTKVSAYACAKSAIGTLKHYKQ